LKDASNLENLFLHMEKLLYGIVETSCLHEALPNSADCSQAFFIPVGPTFKKLPGFKLGD
jgi:hypothetical protein